LTEIIFAIRRARVCMVAYRVWLRGAAFRQDVGRRRDGGGRCKVRAVMSDAKAWKAASRRAQSLSGGMPSRVMPPL